MKSLTELLISRLLLAPCSLFGRWSSTWSPLLLVDHLPPFALLAGRSTEASRVLPDHMSCIKAELLDHLPDRPSIAIALRPQLVGQSIEEQLEEPSTIIGLRPQSLPFAFSSSFGSWPLEAYLTIDLNRCFASLCFAAHSVSVQSAKRPFG